MSHMSEEKQRLMKLRKRINKKRPHFKRFESWRFVRIKDQWRKPRGIDNKMRTEESGWPDSTLPGKKRSWFGTLETLKMWTLRRRSSV